MSDFKQMGNHRIHSDERLQTYMMKLKKNPQLL